MLINGPVSTYFFLGCLKVKIKHFSIVFGIAFILKPYSRIS